MLGERRWAVRHYHVEHESSGVKWIHRVPLDNVSLLTPQGKWRDNILIISVCYSQKINLPYKLTHALRHFSTNVNKGTERSYSLVNAEHRLYHI